MNPVHTLRLLLLAGLAPLIAAPALAQNVGDYYGGLSFGRAHSKFDEQAVANRMLPPGVTTAALTRNDSDLAYKIFGGYQFHEYFAVEAGYFRLGKFDFNATTSPAGALDAQIRLRGLNLDLVGRLPLVEGLYAIGRVGAQYTRAINRYSGSGAAGAFATDVEKDELNYKVGAGLQFEITPAILVRAEAERYRISDAMGNHGHVNAYTVSLVFPIGYTTPATPRSAPRAEASPSRAEASPSRAEANPSRMEAAPYNAEALSPRATDAPVEAPRAAAATFPAIDAPGAAAVAEAPTPAPVRTRPATAVTIDAGQPVKTARGANRSPQPKFEFDRAAVGPAGRAKLDAFSRDLVGAEFAAITVEGHADRLGAAGHNQKLSLQRAESVKTYLVTAGGLDPAKISTVGRGDTGPVTRPGDCVGTRASASLIDCLGPDRRVEVEVLGAR